MKVAEELSQEEVRKIRQNWYMAGDSIAEPGCAPGTIVGFGKRYLQRGGFDHKRAGVYMDFFTIHVVGKDGREWVHNLCPEEARNNGLTGRFADIARLNVRICDLPDTPFWVGDIVSKNVGRQRAESDGVIAEVHHDRVPIQYAVTRATNNPLPAGRWHENGLTLVERGNVWKLEHGEPLLFASLDEEAKFYKSLGMSQKLVNTREKDGLWSMKEAFDMLSLDRVDKITIKGAYGNVPQGPRVVLIKYDNENLGRRVRDETLRQFGITPSCENVEDEDVNFGYCPGEGARAEPDTNEK